MAFSQNAGTEMEIQNVDLNDSTDVQISFTKKPNNILIRNRTTTGDVYLRLSDNATEYFTIPAGLSITLDVGSKVNAPIWLRSQTGTPTVEILTTFD